MPVIHPMMSIQQPSPYLYGANPQGEYQRYDKYYNPEIERKIDFLREGIERDKEELKAIRDPYDKAKFRRSIAMAKEDIKKYQSQEKPKIQKSILTSIPEGPSIRMTPAPSAPVMEPPKPAKYSRAKPTTTIELSIPPQDVAGRYANKFVKNTSAVASALADVGAKPVKEKKKSLKVEEMVKAPVSQSVTASKEYAQYSRQLKERSSDLIQPSAPPILEPALNLRGAFPEKITKETPKVDFKVERGHLTERGVKRIEEHPFEKQLTEKEFNKTVSRLSKPTIRNEQRALLQAPSMFVEPAPLSRPAMMASNMIGKSVLKFGEAGGAREGSGGPTKEEKLMKEMNK